ncbi:hypothetical protein QCA50_014076 [Cerrena zonata]|uniref:Uncharacterized protein n=1 Tax=Cerrena zonata TaxID=2478898 RepID=A0AAW0FNW0_9APHY
MEAYSNRTNTPAKSIPFNRRQFSRCLLSPNTLRVSPAHAALSTDTRDTRILPQPSLPTREMTRTPPYNGGQSTNGDSYTPSATQEVYRSTSRELPSKKNPLSNVNHRQTNPFNQTTTSELNFWDPSLQNGVAAGSMAVCILSPSALGTRSSMNLQAPPVEYRGHTSTIYSPESVGGSGPHDPLAGNHQHQCARTHNSINQFSSPTMRSSLSSSRHSSPAMSESTEDDSAYENDSATDSSCDAVDSDFKAMDSDYEADPGMESESDSDAETGPDLPRVRFTTTPSASPPAIARARASAPSSSTIVIPLSSLSKTLRFMKKDGQFLTYSFTAHNAIEVPPQLPGLGIGTLFVRLDSSSLDVLQVWVWSQENNWRTGEDGDAHPTLPHRCLSIRSIAGRTEANWVLKNTYKTYKQRELRQKMLSQYGIDSA